ncbi:MAG: DUF429 domain-containing protein [Halobacteriales archaeon]|nr:DUF429 domain-containing protein [Halobacteriales archaeon]
MHVAGVDGCPGGWFVVELTGPSTFDHRVVGSIESFLDECDPTLVLVDSPIGLLESPGQRACDRLARQALSPTRHASVFTPPSRQALAADSYADANARNRAAIDKGLQIQAWHITEKIAELDRLVRDQPTVQGMIRESHPEVCFWGLHGEPMASNKQTEAGRQARLSVLTSIEPTIATVYAEACDRYRRATVGRDDIIDALCLALVAARGLDCEELATLPADPPTDPKGLPMEMVYWSKATGTAPDLVASTS